MPQESSISQLTTMAPTTITTNNATTTTVTTNLTLQNDSTCTTEVGFVEVDQKVNELALHPTVGAVVSVTNNSSTLEVPHESIPPAGVDEADNHFQTTANGQQHDGKEEDATMLEEERVKNVSEEVQAIIGEFKEKEKEAEEKKIAEEEMEMPTEHVLYPGGKFHSMEK